MGRRLQLASRAFANLGVRGEDVPASSVRQLCKWTIEMLGSSTARWWDCLGRSDPVVIFTDASYEKGVARWGVVVIDPVTSTRRVASGLVPEQLLTFWHLDIKDQVICQAEAFAAGVAVRGGGAGGGVENKNNPGTQIQNPALTQEGTRVRTQVQPRFEPSSTQGLTRFEPGLRPGF